MSKAQRIFCIPLNIAKKAVLFACYELNNVTNCGLRGLDNFQAVSWNTSIEISEAHMQKTLKKTFIIGLILMPLVTFGSETLKGAKKDIESFKTSMNEKLQKLENEIEAAKIKAKNKGHATSDQTISELESARDKIKKNLSELKEEGDESWQKAKKNLSEALDELNTKVQKKLRN